MHNHITHPSGLRLCRDLIHKLGQPLTALHCSLEIALRKHLDAQEYRLALEQALSLSGLLLQITGSERSLIESLDPGNPLPVDLSSIVRDQVEDFAPVFRQAGLRLFAEIEEFTWIGADPTRIRSLLFVLLEQLLETGKNRQELLLLLAKQCGRAVLYAGPTSSQLASPGAYSSTAVQTQSIHRAANMTRAIGGRLDFLETAVATTFLLSFPLVNGQANVSTDGQQT